MTHRADAAHARAQGGHLPQQATPTELLKASELGDVEAGIGDLALLVSVDGDLGVAFDAADRIDQMQSRGAGHG